MTLRHVGALAALLLLVAGCSANAATDPTAEGVGGELQGTTWVLQSFASGGVLTTVPDDQYADAEFTALRVKGFSGCNQYDAAYRTGGRMLLVGLAAVTLMACPEATSAFESTYLGLLHESRFFNIRGDTLTIRGADRSVLLVFEVPPANPLLGSWVVDSFESAPGKVTVPLEGTTLTAVFRFGKVAGSAGCNTYQGPYTTNGDAAAIGPLATTLMACAEDVSAQEAAFLTALQGVARIQTRAQTVQLQDRNGSLVVALLRASAVEPSPSPSGAPSASASTVPSASPSASPTAKPTASPSPTPTASPTPAPTPTPTAVPTASPAPTLSPPPSLPALATCTVTASPDVPVAALKYPATWHTVAAPPTLACRYFDPKAITVPADPTTLTTAVMVKADPVGSYADALTAATNPTAWNVLRNEAFTISGLPATRIEATSTAGSPDVPVGSTRYAYLIDYGGHPVWIETVGTAGDATYVSNTKVVDLIAATSTFLAPPAP
jgi:heat shock protein HslJ